MKKPLNTTKLLIVSLTAIIVLSVLIFLFDREGTNGPTGWETLAMEGAGFWIWAIFGIVGAAACVYFLIKNDQRSGPEWRTWALLALAILLFFSPWGKACTDKANYGVTAPHYKAVTK